MLDLEKLKAQHERWQMCGEEEVTAASEALLEQMPEIIEQLEKVVDNYKLLHRLACGGRIDLIKGSIRETITLRTALLKETSAVLASFGVDTGSEVNEDGAT